VLPFGFLIFVVGALLIASAWAVIDAKLAVTSAAREAARTYVEAPSRQEAVESGTAAALEALENHGRGDDARQHVDFDEPASFSRCAPVVAEVSYDVPAVPLPWLGGLGQITVTSRHRERIDPFRNGVPGAAACTP